MKITVLHAYYGCDTGCCGHVIDTDGEFRDIFSFHHPYSNDLVEIRKWAEDWIREELGEEHVKDLDWENCHIVND